MAHDPRLIVNAEELSAIEHIRRRPTMYLGTTGFFGLIHYLVSAVNVLLERSPTWVSIQASADGFTIRSDAAIQIEESNSGEILPFEDYTPVQFGMGRNAPLLTALSAHLTIQTVSDGQCCRLAYTQGERTSPIERDNGGLSEGVGTELQFAPDHTIFTVSAFSTYNFDSYLHRISFLNPEVKFSFTTNEVTRVFHAPDGIREMFESVIAPYQILHKPVHVRQVEEGFDLEIVWAFHSSRQRCLVLHQQGAGGRRGKARTRARRSLTCTAQETRSPKCRR